jgi:hypothetical protein
LLPCWLAFPQEPVVEITGIEVNDEAVVVTYDLRGDSTEVYEAKLYLLSERQPASLRELKAVSGDLTGRPAGKGRRIIWTIRGDLPNPGPGDAHRIRVIVESPGPWYTRWYVLTAGGLMVGTAVAIVLIDNDSPPAAVVPMPPARP